MKNQPPKNASEDFDFLPLLPPIPGMNRKKEVWVNKFTEASAQTFRQQMMEAASDSPDKPIVVYIDSYGGSVDALAMMLETMDEIQNPIITACLGKAMSCGAILLSHGDIRLIGRHSSVMVHDVSGGAFGDVHDMAATTNEIKRMSKYFLGLLAKNCGLKNYDAIRKIIQNNEGRDLFMDASQALKFGIVDAIGVPKVKSAIPEKPEYVTIIQTQSNRPQKKAKGQSPKEPAPSKGAKKKSKKA